MTKVIARGGSKGYYIAEDSEVLFEDIAFWEDEIGDMEAMLAVCIKGYEYVESESESPASNISEDKKNLRSPR